MKTQIYNSCIFRLGEGWEDPVHRETLHESVDAVPKEEKLKEAEKPLENIPEEKSSTETEEKNENVPLPTSSPSNEELAKMWQPKTRQSIAQRLKRKFFRIFFFYDFFFFRINFKFFFFITLQLMSTFMSNPIDMCSLVLKYTTTTMNPTFQAETPIPEVTLTQTTKRKIPMPQLLRHPQKIKPNLLKKIFLRLLL